LSNQLHP